MRKEFLCILLSFILIFFMSCIGLPTKEGRREGNLKIQGRWEIIGPDGGDMHFIYRSSSGTLFASHGFGGFFRSTDNGESWSLIYNDDFVDMNIQAMGEVDNTLFAGGNGGLWVSFNDGESWERIKTNIEGVDENPSFYEIVSIIPVSEKRIFITLIVDKKFRERKELVRDGIFELTKVGDEWSPHFHKLPVDKESINDAITMFLKGDTLFVSSSENGLFTYNIEDGGWKKIFDGKTTRVYADDLGRVFFGTIGDYFYWGEFKGKWVWHRIVIPNKPKDLIFHFIIPDPNNPDKLWFGTGDTSRSGIYIVKLKERRHESFIGTGFYDFKKERWISLSLSPNWGPMIAIDPTETINTSFGLTSKVALIPQAGHGCIQKTEDGGKTWRDSYDGIYGDTINEVTYIKEGVRKGDVVVNCVSGIEILKDFNKWEEGIDFRIGRIDGKMAGYTWRDASPIKKIDGRYDLLVSSGYPPTDFTGNGVFLVDTDCIKKKGKGCIRRLFSAPCFDIEILNERLFIGRMDEGISIYDLKNGDVKNIKFGDREAGINIRVFDGDVFVSTIIGGNRNSDNYFFSDRRAKGGIYILKKDKPEAIYRGKRIISFSVKKGELIGLTNSNSLIYFEDFRDKKFKEFDLPHATYSDMEIDWEDGVIFISTFDSENDGVLYIDLKELRKGDVLLKPLNNGILTKRVRNITLIPEKNILFAGTEGHSVWKLNFTLSRE